MDLRREEGTQFMTETQRQETKVIRHKVNPMGAAFLNGFALAVSCWISFWLITHILAHAYSVSRDDDLLGGMWAVAATVFVHRYSYKQSVRAALSRMAATSISFALCLVYLLTLPFRPWGMAMLIGIGAVVMTRIGRPDDIVTTGITTAVVMVVAALSPRNAWQQPILRMIDTAVGVAVGVAAAWISLSMTLRRRKLREPVGSIKASSGA
jgi:uncharacterized membrane protein YgaE (UPF0421/DUF939 family)